MIIDRKSHQNLTQTCLSTCTCSYISMRSNDLNQHISLLCNTCKLAQQAIVSRLWRETKCLIGASLLQVCRKKFFCNKKDSSLSRNHTGKHKNIDEYKEAELKMYQISIPQKNRKNTDNCTSVPFGKS